jgi:tyrosine phenol-lyase
MQTIIEPFKIKAIEPIRFTTYTERREILEKAGYNLFNVQADDVLIDLLTDSGTAAMSARQWAGIMDGDEAYAGSRSFYRFERVVRDITGFRYILPTHQGRAAERILFSILGGPGKVIPNNTHFDTTRANVEAGGAEALDLPRPEASVPSAAVNFKGNMDLEALEALIRKDGHRIPVCVMTVTNNSSGGQPVSMDNIRKSAELCRRHDIPLFLDACRFAENAYFIKLREPGYDGKSAKAIAAEMFALVDGCFMSAKKDALVNIGGFLAMNDEKVARRARDILVRTEGFPTYGGLAGRDLEAIAQGLVEVLDEHYLEYRLRSVAYVGEHLDRLGVPYFKPTGGHAIYLDAKGFLPHIPPQEFPGQALACKLYQHGGIRSCEIGSVMFGRTDPTTGQFRPARMELVRLAVPRRVYTQSHMDYVVECIGEVFQKRGTIKGMKIVWEPQVLRHFTARFAPL